MPKKVKKQKLSTRKLPAKKKRSSKSRKKKGFLGKLIKYVFLLALFGCAFISAIIAYYAYQLPDISQINNSKSKPSITIRAPDGVILANYGDIHGNYLDYNEFPSYLIDALISTEDRRFFEHGGVDVFGILRAMYANQKAGRIVQGGSTITQQLAKILFLSPKKTFKRKIQEVMLAIKLEKQFSKEEILSAYLNRVFPRAREFWH